VGSYTYPTTGKVHAVSAVPGTNYTYDSNGNLANTGFANFTWTVSNMPNVITAGAWNYTWDYDADNNRVKYVSPNEMHLYFGRKNKLLFEAIYRSTTDQLHVIYANGAPVAEYTIRSSGVNDTRYFYRDHLGSLTLVANESGVVTERLSYDANGKRRFTNGNDDTGNTLSGAATDRGYTWHEHLDEIGLIHMNGRLYDPKIGRFVSADPTEPSTSVVQSFNRYTYGSNNPMLFIDPSGYTNCDVVITCHTWWISAPGTSGSWVDAQGGCETCLVDDGDPGPSDEYWRMVAGPSLNPTARPAYSDQIQVSGRRRFELPPQIDLPSPGLVDRISDSTRDAARGQGRDSARGDCRIAALIAGLLGALGLGGPDATSLNIPLGDYPVGIGLTVDRYGRWYLGTNVGVGYPAAGVALIHRDPPNGSRPREDLGAFLEGPAFNLGSVVGGIWGPQGFAWTIQTPGIGVSNNYSPFCGG